MKFPTQHKIVRTTDNKDPMKGVIVHRIKNEVWATKPTQKGDVQTVFSRTMPTVREAKAYMQHPYI